MLRHGAAPLAQRPGAARPPPRAAPAAAPPSAAALFRRREQRAPLASLRAAASGQKTTSAPALSPPAPAAPAAPPAPSSALASSPAAVDAMSALYHLPRDDWARAALSVVVVGASGDLAKKKIFPALFALYYEGLLPPRFQVFGYARSGMTDAEFRERVGRTLACRVSAGAKCAEAQERFLARCFYVSGPYDTPEGFGALDARMAEQERSHFEGEEGEGEGRAGGGGNGSSNGSAGAGASRSANGGGAQAAAPPQAHRMFFLSIPPSVFTAAAANAAQHCASPTGWTRVIVEKPFGRDAESSAALGRDLAQHLTEEQIYRIDHYLGKELIENLTVLRFSNLVFEPLWSRQYIRNVQVIFSEDFGTEGRGGYFDSYGIIRDVIQNHLLQIVALFAMEPPVSLDAEDIRNEKVKVLRAMRPVRPEDVVVGQYRGRAALTPGGKRLPGYQDDDTVPPGSICPTFAAVAMRIDNARWDGVPFLLKAGKALQKRSAEIRVQFRHVPGNLYRGKLGSDLDAASNELVINIQPKEAIYLKVNNKVPGLGLKLGTTRLDLTYAAAYGDVAAGGLPDAYERLLLDVVNGDKRLFIRADELEAAWALFTPALHHLEAARVAPEPYPYGSRGPVGAHYLAAQHGVRWGDIGGGGPGDEE